MQYAILQEAWNNFRDLKVRIFLVLRYSFWGKKLLGVLHQPHNESVDEKMEWMLVNHASFQ
jgi:hypothetical protein